MEGKLPKRVIIPSTDCHLASNKHEKRIFEFTSPATHTGSADLVPAPINTPRYMQHMSILQLDMNIKVINQATRVYGLAIMSLLFTHFSSTDK